jgi:amino-acid N-acetyltransferase
MDPLGPIQAEWFPFGYNMGIRAFTRGPSPMNSSDVIIRAALSADVPQIAELIEPFVEAKKLLPRTDAELVDLTRNGFVAVADDRIVGFAAVEVYSKKLAEVQCLAVCGTRQREGIGKRLVRQCIRRSES